MLTCCNTAYKDITLPSLGWSVLAVLLLVPSMKNSMGSMPLHSNVWTYTENTVLYSLSEPKVRRRKNAPLFRRKPVTPFIFIKSAGKKIDFWKKNYYYLFFCYNRDAHVSFTWPTLTRSNAGKLHVEVEHDEGDKNEVKIAPVRGEKDHGPFLWQLSQLKREKTHHHTHDTGIRLKHQPINKPCCCDLIDLVPFLIYKYIYV